MLLKQIALSKYPGDCAVQSGRMAKQVVKGNPKSSAMENQVGSSVLQVYPGRGAQVNDGQASPHDSPVHCWCRTTPVAARLLGPHEPELNLLILVTTFGGFIWVAVSNRMRSFSEIAWAEVAASRIESGRRRLASIRSI